MPSTPATALQLGFAAASSTPSPPLSVDGMLPLGPNLSHWPGNRTPAIWRQDLSTGIALAFSRADAAAQTAFLAGATVVLNDHYDTDGFGSLLAVLRPEIACGQEELLLAAAATGDFGCWHTWRGFAIDRTVVGLADERSPVRREFAGLDGDALSLKRYRWLLDHATDVLATPEVLAPIWSEELRRVQDELAAGRLGAVQRRRHDELDFAVVTAARTTHRLVLNTLSGAFRVLHVAPTRDGCCYRYHDRTESWFELVTVHALPRRDLRPVAERLRTLEPDRDGARWCADPPTEPIPELYFGVPSAQEYGQITRQLHASRLRQEQVEHELLAAFTGARG
ncbi:MAG: hypothetical protein IPK26_00825 [Planctomycetes bacterium]|nr:hypothetical protein [Planctomycetota bacterium]